MNPSLQHDFELVASSISEKYDEWFGHLLRTRTQANVRQFISQVGELTDDEVAAVLCMDQLQRWQIGERVMAEEYMRSEYRLTIETATDLAYQEFLLREQWGERPSVEEYRQRFPQLANLLCMQIELHLAITQAERSQIDSASATQPMVAPLTEDWPTIKGYTITSELGCGGMGVVYRARQWGLNRTVALKVVKNHAEANSEDLVRLLSEAETVALLQHPHIVQIYEVGESDGCTYLALEFVDGGNLEDKYAGVAPPTRQVARIIEQVARAVHFAHQHGVVHRDLKPANILLTTDGVPKIADFGLSKRIEWDTELVGGCALVGTPTYMSPEQAEVRVDAIGPPADIYSLGATLYFLITGRPPFEAESAENVLEQVVDNEPIAPRYLRADVDHDIEMICMKCLQKLPGRRYESAEELADDLDRYARGQQVRAGGDTWCMRP